MIGPVIALASSFLALGIAFQAGRYIEMSNLAYRAGEPAMWDGLTGIGLFLLSIILIGAVLCVVVKLADQVRRQSGWKG